MLNCCCSGPPPPPPCTITVNLRYRSTSFGMTGEGGSPISGGTVTLTGGITTSGTTDSDGNYTFTVGAGASATLTVAYGGCSYTQTVGPGNCGTIYVCFCDFTTTLVVAGPSSGITVNMGGISVPAYTIFDVPCTDGASTPIGICSVSGSTWTFTFCSLDLCSNPLYLPIDVGFTASAAGWVMVCSPQFNPACGVDNTFDVTMYYWPTCYQDYLCGPGPTGTTVAGQDWSCCSPPCVPVATSAGYYPKTIDVKWTSVNAPYGPTACNLFGPDEGAWITLTLASDVVTAVGAAGVRTLTWSSGCRSGGTYFLPPTAQAYGSSSVTLVSVCSSAHGGAPAVTLSYDRWIDGGCAPTTGSPPDTHTYAIGGSGPTPSFAVCSPVSVDLGPINDVYSGHATCQFTCDLIEVACTPSESPVVTSGGA